MLSRFAPRTSNESYRTHSLNTPPRLGDSNTERALQPVDPPLRPLPLALQYQHGPLAHLPSNTFQTGLLNLPPCVTATPESKATSFDPEHESYWLRVYEDDPPDEPSFECREAPTTVLDVSQVAQTSQDEQMKAVKTKATIGILSTLIAYVSVNSWLKTTHPDLFIWCDEDREDAHWIATSKSWIDRKVCRWLGICGGSHMHFALNPFGFNIGRSAQQGNENQTSNDYWQSQWFAGDVAPSHSWSEKERSLRDIPGFVMEYAPIIHLFSKEQFWPCDIAEHLYHTTPALNYTPIQSESQHETLSTLDELNKWENGRFVFLTSNDNVEERPEWLEGAKNIPTTASNTGNSDANDEELVHQPGRTYMQGLKDAAESLGGSLATEADLSDAGQLKQEAAEILRQELKRRGASSSYKDEDAQVRGGRSSAPAILVTVAKPDGVLDAFWFFFYSFNLGNSVLNIRFGNHVGDWEHTAIRFKHGKPAAVYFSEHNFGSAYSYEAVEKIGKRPVLYSATGTHAMYATPGLHPYILPWGILHDETDRGPLWDPALNHHSYTYDFKSDTLRASALTPKSPTGWFHFAGHWGDKFYALGDSRQYRFAGQYHYVNGPLGPKFKNLGRKEICGGPDGTPCAIKHWIDGAGKISRTTGYGEEPDEWSAAAKAQFDTDLQSLDMISV